jgi:hypothetical protein
MFNMETEMTGDEILELHQRVKRWLALFCSNLRTRCFARSQHGPAAADSQEADLTRS